MQKSPALWAPVEAKWLEAAFNEFENGKPEIAFRTDAEIGQAGESPIKHVYFKTTGTTEVVAVADFIRLTTTNPKQQRLIGQEDKESKYYYIFRALDWLPAPIPLSSLHRFSTGTALRNDTPGACIIENIS
jgi:hypothetical protein